MKISKESGSMNTKVQTKQDILRLLQEQHAQLRAFGVKSLGLFGSFVREQQTSDSDIDFLVEFETGQKTFNNFIQLAFFLEDQLQRKVELVTRESLSPYIGPHILKEVEYASLTS